MKKAEILELLKENNVTSKNLRTFLSKKIAYKALNFQKILGWLEKLEAEQARKDKIASQKRKSKSFNMSYRKYLTLREKAKDILADFETGYSMGETKYLFLKSNIFLRIDHTSEYAKSCSWSAKHGRMILQMKKPELINIEKKMEFGNVQTAKK